MQEEKNPRRKEPDNTKDAVRSFVTETMDVNHSRDISFRDAGDESFTLSLKINYFCYFSFFLGGIVTFRRVRHCVIQLSIGLSDDDKIHISVVYSQGVVYK
jgi:hypothetical protein